MNREIFYDSVRKQFGPLSQSQVEGFEAILNEWNARGYKDKRWLAYMLATAWHETARTMQAIEEFGKGKGKRYGKKVLETGKVYYGRGLVQLTWAQNYKTMSKLLNVELYKHPELALDLDIAVRIMFEGMLTDVSLRGDFTGKSLEQYFNTKTDDALNARRIINGLDCAEKIKQYHLKFLQAIQEASPV